MDDYLMKNLHDEFEFSLDAMARRLREVGRHSATDDKPAFHDAVESCERTRRS